MAAESEVGIPKTPLAFHNKKYWNCIIFLSFSLSISTGILLYLIICNYKVLTFTDYLSYFLMGGFIGCIIVIPLTLKLASVLK